VFRNLTVNEPRPNTSHSARCFHVAVGKRAQLPFRLAWTALCLILSTLAGAQSSSKGDGSDSCAALMRLNLMDVQGGPARIISARVVDVPDGIQRTNPYPSGYSDGTSLRSSEIRQYCDVTGYAAPQNKFELKLPL
jgi:hypothetical protein